MVRAAARSSEHTDRQRQRVRARHGNDRAERPPLQGGDLLLRAESEDASGSGQIEVCRSIGFAGWHALVRAEETLKDSPPLAE